MVILVYSPIYEISEIIREAIEQTGESCYSFRNSCLITEFLMNSKNVPDLLILDYTSYNHEFFCLRNLQKKVHRSYPYIFFNDPCIVYRDRALQWKEQMKLIFQIKDENKLKKLDAIFSCVMKTVEDPGLKPYIPLMQDVLPFPHEESRAQRLLRRLSRTTPPGLFEFRRHSGMSESLFYLLQVFYEHRETPMTLDQILERYRQDGKQMTAPSLKVLISRLRKELESDTRFAYHLQKKNDTYQVIFF